MTTPNWQHNSGKRHKTKGMAKAVIRARKQAKQALLNQLLMRYEGK